VDLTVETSEQIYEFSTISTVISLRDGRSGCGRRWIHCRASARAGIDWHTNTRHRGASGSQLQHAHALQTGPMRPPFFVRDTNPVRAHHVALHQVRASTGPLQKALHPRPAIVTAAAPRVGFTSRIYDGGVDVSRDCVREGPRAIVWHRDGIFRYFGRERPIREGIPQAVRSHLKFYCVMN
jgi:hypothetical protein